MADPKKPGSATGAVGAPVSPIGTAAKKATALGAGASSVASRVASQAPAGGVGSVASGVANSLLPKTAPTAAPTPDAPASTPAPATLTADEQSVYTQIAGVLGQAGLSSLWQTVWDKSLAGEGNDQILFELEQTPEYKTRFAGNVALQAKGQTPLKPGDYLQYETAVRNQAELYGIDTSHTSDAAIAELIGGGVSASEATQRLATFYQASQQIDPAARDYLAKNYGITTGNLMDVFMNPDQHLAALQAKVNAAQIGGTAANTGWGNLDADYAMKLAQAGVSPTAAASSFSKLAGFGELTQVLPGDTGGSVSQADELSAEFDQNAAAQQKLQNVASSRVARFQNQGGFAGDQSGAVGLRDQSGPY